VSNDQLRVDLEEELFWVTLSGHVDSWVEHDAAVNAAWAAPGVRAVEDEIVVDY
jgi:osmotically-inducible protein OsmY